MNLRLLLIVALFGTGSLLWSQEETTIGEPIRVPLTVTEAANDGPYAFLKILSTCPIFPERQVPDSIKSAPELQNPAYYYLKFGNRKFLAILSVDEAAAGAKLYIDFEGEGLFADIQPMEGIGQPYGANHILFQFEPIVLAKSGDGGAVEAKAERWVAKGEVESPPFLQLTPRNVISGTLQIGDNAYAVAFIDKGFTGRFEPAQPATDKDPRRAFLAFLQAPTFMGIGLSQSEMLKWPGEIFPLVRLVGIENKYYRVNVEPDGSAATFQEVELASGVLDVQSPDVSVFVWSDQYAAMLDSNEKGQWELPAGQYNLFVLSLTSQSDGDTWTLQGDQPGETMKDFEIKPHTPTVLEIGSPLAIQYDISRKGDEVSIRPILAGKGDETYRPDAQKAGEYQERSAPTFTIFDENGEELAKGTFEYG